MKNPYAELLASLRGKQTAAAGGTSQQNQQVEDWRAPLQYLSDQPQAAITAEIMRRLQSIDERLARLEQALGGQGRNTRATHPK